MAQQPQKVLDFPLTLDAKTRLIQKLDIADAMKIELTEEECILGIVKELVGFPGTLEEFSKIAGVMRLV